MNVGTLNAWHSILSEFSVRDTVLICSTFRSGSTYVAELIKYNSMVGDGIILEKFATLADVHEADADGIQAVFREIFSTTRNGIFCSKLMWPNRNEICRLLGLRLADSGAFCELFPNCKWIRVTRQSIFDQAVSFWRAKKSNEWHVYSSKIAQETPYDFQEIDTAFREICSHQFLWDEFFKRAGITPTIIEYDQLLSDGYEYLEQKLGMGGIYVNPPGSSSAVSLVRQADRHSRYVTDLYIEDLFRLPR